MTSAAQTTVPGTTTLTLMAPVSGILVPLDDVPDPAFAQRLAGDGVSIDPLSDTVVAPCDAQVRHVHRAAHAVTLETHGLEIVIHVGLDTVKLRGEGFTPLVKGGSSVRMGDPLIRFDADAVARRARSLLTEVLITNMDVVLALRPRTGRVVAGRDVALEVDLRDSPGSISGPPHVAANDEPVTSAPIVVASATGLHARPAAVVAATARRFAADVRLVKEDGQEANARSVVSVMTLEVGHGDAVRVVARGRDAQAAVDAISEMLATDLDAGARGDAAPGGSATPVAQSSRASRLRADGLLAGVPASPGVAVGRVFRLEQDDVVIEERGADPALERRALDTAIATARMQIESLQDRFAAEADASRAEIFEAHRVLLDDPEVLERAAAEIRAGASAAHAWRTAYTSQAERLLVLDNPVLAGRATDLRDIGRRVLHLLAGHTETAAEIPPESVVIAEDLTPSDTASLDRTRVLGLCTTMGSATSHAAILARGLGIPAVAGADPRVLELAPGTRVILDGDAGTLDPAPDEERVRAAVTRRQAVERQRGDQLAVAAEPATTRDGHRVEVVANIGAEKEAARVPEVGGEGVGLLRTEFLFMDRRTAPDEDQQARTYEAIARALGPERILIIRTLDVGGDKPIPYLDLAPEANPFLGERGVRLTLARPELFRAQVRGILRASQAGKVAVMFPMIATIAEWRAARALVEQERAALGVPPIPVGIMVETAAAALLAERFAREADFFSIGTNDLTQYTLAMDRTNPRLAPQVDALHPAVLRLIERTVHGAEAHGRWVGVCGALAGDVAAVPVLLGLGVTELSVDIPLVPAVKARVRTLSLEECRVTAREALEAEDGAEVRAIVERRHDTEEL
ncbi:MAG: ptsI [Geminicoccaceae bacterium]|nr:ptsI [Geminicoccaceae bacterium]